MVTLIKKIMITTILLSLFFSVSAFAKNKAAEKENKRFKENKVSVMNEFLFFPKTNTQKKMNVQTFDVNGNKLSTIDLDNDEKQIKKVEYVYNLNGRDSSFVEYDASNNIRQKVVYKYDNLKNERLAEELFYNENGNLNYKRTAKYDRNDILSEQLLYDKNNKFINRSVYKYDKDGNKIETILYNSNNVFNGRYFYNYDNKDNLIEILSYDKNNKFSGKKIFNYSPQNLLIETIGYNATGMANSWRKYEYEYHKYLATTVVKPTEQNKNEPAKVAKQSEQSIITEQHPLLSNSTLSKQNDNHNNEPAFTEIDINKNKLNYDYYAPPSDIVIDSVTLIGNCGFYPENTVIKLMDHNNIDVNSINEMGQSLLMIAASSGKVELVEELLKKGAKPDLKDFYNDDVLEYAKSSGNSKILNIIKNAIEK